MPYIDAFVLPVSRKDLPAYRRMSRKTGKVWRDCGALEFRECVGDDLQTKFAVPFPRRIRLKRGETVVFSWIMYRSRADRDRINAKAMKDPRMAGLMDMNAMPFDVKRMLAGGFRVFVDV